MRVFLFFVLPLLMMAYPARAETDTIYQCGAPEKAEDTGFNTDPGESAHFCDIYTRQLAYLEEKKKFREMLVERQKNFVVPRQQARANYEKSLDARWKAANPADKQEKAGPAIPASFGND